MQRGQNAGPAHRQFTPAPKIRPMDEEVPWSPTVRYLELTIDRILSMASHVEAVVTKAQLARTKLRLLLSSKLSIQTKLGKYRTYIRSRLTLSGPVWNNLTTGTARKRLEAAENRCLRMTVDVPKYLRNSTGTHTSTGTSSGNLHQKTGHGHVRAGRPLHLAPLDRHSSIAAPGNNPIRPQAADTPRSEAHHSSLERSDGDPFGQ